jgi:competence protein ComEC
MNMVGGVSFTIFPGAPQRDMGAMASRLQCERERWILWTPVPMAAGIALYFAWPSEPSLWLGLAALICSVTAVAVSRHPLILGALLLSLGFFAAEWRSHSVAAPILRQPTGSTRLQGRVLSVEPAERGQKVVLDRLTGYPVENIGLQRVRLRLRADYGLRPGQRVQLRASLMPPPPPLVPGGYDFSRQAWFQRIGAVGYAVGKPIQLKSSGDSADLWLERQRQALTRRIVGSIEQKSMGVVAAALVTGQRGPVPPAILASFRDAGLAHILVIAGMHLSMVAGLVLVGLRAVLALIPWMALRFPIHKWTAFGALLVTFGYLLISGAPVPTQRAFIMNGCVLLAILLDRQAVSLRTITLAAMLVLLVEPEALIGASFQLSFAAVYGLIAGYEALAGRLAAFRQSAKAWWQMPLLYAAGILLTTQIAGSATAFYSLYHFSRYALYSLLGNVLAVPIVGFWVMPAALLAFCLMPFGLDRWGWQLMGAGLEVVSRIAHWVSHLPGAVVTAPAMPLASLLLFSLGSAWLILWRRAWRLWGVLPMAAAVLLAATQRPPDLLLDGNLKLAALREADGHLHQTYGKGGRDLREAWVKLVGEDSMPLLSEGSGLTCDETGCTARTTGGEWRLPLDRAHMAQDGTYLVWFHRDRAPTVATAGDWQGRRPWRSAALLGAPRDATEIH